MRRTVVVAEVVPEAGQPLRSLSCGTAPLQRPRYHPPLTQPRPRPPLGRIHLSDLMRCLVAAWPTSVPDTGDATCGPRTVSTLISLAYAALPSLSSPPLPSHPPPPPDSSGCSVAALVAPYAISVQLRACADRG
eukprot:3145085-Rhodomonas_salina.3